MTMLAYEKPRWLREFRRFLPLKSQFAFSGNIRDLQVQQTPAGVAAVPFMTAVTSELYEAGIDHIVLFEPDSGARALERPGASEGQVAPLPAEMTSAEGDQAGLRDLLDRVSKHQGSSVSLIVDYASRLINRGDSLTAPEQRLFTRALMASHKARPRPSGQERQPLYNSVIWIIEKEGDLPDWLLIDNPRIRHVPVPKPDHRARRAFADRLVSSLPAADSAPALDVQAAVQQFVDGTDGLLLLDMSAVAQLARTEKLSFSDIGNAVRRYKVGVTEDPWKQLDTAKIKGAEDFVAKRVKGQEVAVTHVLDIVKRAVTGVGNSRRGGRPRGVVFLAGPTGVGKTELAKTVTSLIFGDESAYIRFDMSEFSAEHADQRLIGAPPGYVGYDVGGELTNAVRERPFSVVLFDEIEKAHPRILDKFLQVLDDGVLTSGRGDRVYFSEAFIVFTSNLGIYKTDAAGERVPNVTPDEPYEVVRDKVTSEIARHFKLVLNRPEILNRIGDNVIVFDFIRPDIAEQIFEQMVDGTLVDLTADGINVSLSQDVRSALKKICLQDLSNGGRGIRNKVDTHLINPLSRSLFDLDAAPGQSFLIDGIETEPKTVLRLSRAG